MLGLARADNQAGTWQMACTGTGLRCNPNDHALERRGFAFGVECSTDENVALGVVHCGVAGFDFWELRGTDVWHRTGGAMDRHALAVVKPQATEVVGVEKDDVAAFDAAIDV